MNKNEVHEKNVENVWKSCWFS